jgi:beta-lactamase superfamily II metal-dependent hydrolase
MRVILSVMLLFLLIISNAYGMKVPKVDLHVSQDEYAISFLPVQKGEVAVLHLASGDHYMINTGSFKDRNQLYYYFNQLHIDNIKGLIITEKSEVDERMIAELVEKFSIEEIVVGKSLEPDMPTQVSRIVHPVQEDQTYTFSDELSMRVVHDGNERREGLDFSITFFHHRFLWMSSQSSHSEGVLLSKSLKNVNIVKIPVHSKSESMSQRLLEHVDPQTAILYRSKERLLNGDMLEAINEEWIDLYLTGQHGLIAVKFNKRNYEVLTFDQGDGVFKEEE